MNKSKRIVSNPMTYQEIQASRTLYGDMSQIGDDSNFNMRTGHDYNKAVMT